jgi:CubicO group peptidase (beta-lactamase class C family)
MRMRKSFPLIVFVAALAAIEVAIALSVFLSRPAELPVTHGATTPKGADALIDSGAVDAFMLENLRISGSPGAILAIVKDGKVLHTAGYGYTSTGAPVTPETPMPIASLSKSMTAAASMRLVEDGTLALDEAVLTYLPDLELADPRAARITIRQLLNQSSGLAPRTLPPKPARLPRSLTEELEWLRPATLASDPGTEFNYCNENYILLAGVLERVGGMPFDAFLAQRLFGPLDMRESRVFFAGREPKPGVAKGHGLVYGAQVLWEMPDEITSAAGGVVSSASDLAHWLSLNTPDGTTTPGAALLSVESVTALHTVSAPASNYGFGWRRDALADGTTNIHHSGIARSFTAHERLFPDSGYAYAFVLDGGHFFRVEGASFMYGLNSIMMGLAPNTGPPFSFFGLSLGLVADNLMAILTAFCIAIGIVGSLRARAWAERRAHSSWFTIGLRLAPYAAVTLGVATERWLLSVINRGQPVDPLLVFSYWPPLGVLSVAAALAGSSVVVLRCVHLASAKRG